MTTQGLPNYEIPTELRELAEQSVQQARKTFTGFLDAAHRAIETFEGSTTTLQSGANDISRRTLAYAEQNVTAAFDLAQKLVRARDVNEAMQYQADYLKSQLASLQDQLKDFSVAVQKAGETATKRAAE